MSQRNPKSPVFLASKINSSFNQSAFSGAFSVKIVSEITLIPFVDVARHAPESEISVARLEFLDENTISWFLEGMDLFGHSGCTGSLLALTKGRAHGDHPGGG
jgi:hypothetical protein